MEKSKNNNSGSVKSNQVRMRQGIGYVSVTVCAKMLGVSKSTVYEMLKEGRIEGAFRINRSWRIPIIEPKSKIHESQENNKK